jgi:hypothetical protein
MSMDEHGKTVGHDGSEMVMTVMSYSRCYMVLSGDIMSYSYE